MVHTVIKNISQEQKGSGFGLLLLLHCLFHADRVHHQLQVGQDLVLVAADVALDGLVGQQLGEVALGHHQRIVVIRQVGALVGFGLLYVLALLLFVKFAA